MSYIKMSYIKRVGSRIFFVGIFSAALLASLSLLGCGGGGGGDSVPLSAGRGATSTADKTPPRVSNTSPSNAAIGVALNSSILVTFSKAMKNSSLNTTSFTLAPTAGGTAVTGTVIVGSNSAMFQPPINLTANTQYTATLTTGVADAAGNALPANFTWKFTTSLSINTTPPTITVTSPADAATGLAANSSISATFSEAMAVSTLNTGTFILKTTTGSVLVNGTVSVSGNIATFKPSSPLSFSTGYTAIITTGVADASGNAMAADYIWTFTTSAAPDTTPPTVSDTSPATGATGVALNSSLSAAFSKPMTNATLNTASFTVRTALGGVAVAGTVSVSGQTATFRPSAALAGSTEYFATIATAAMDAAGNALAANFTWTITTAALPDTTPPTVSATSPANAATGVALGSPVVATFSKSMANSSTLTPSTFTLQTTLGGVAIPGAVSVNGNTATFTPSAPLVANTTYTATLTTGVGDAAGNALAADFIWKFTTAPATAPSTTAILTWGAAAGANLSGYRVYYGTAPGTYFQSFGQGVNVGNVLTYTVNGLTSGTRYYFAVTAFDTSNNESIFSNEVFKDIP